MIEEVTRRQIGWFQSKIAELRIDSKRKNALIEMKYLVQNSEKKVLNDIVHNVSVKPLFQYLLAGEQQDVEDVCVIIYELLSEMSVTNLLETYGKLIHKSLFHKSDEVKETVLKLLQKNFGETLALNYTKATLLNQHGSLLVDATNCVASENRSTAQGAISLLIRLGNSSEGADVLFSKQILDKLKDIMNRNDTARFRVYEIIVSVSKLSSENLSKGISSGLIEQLFSEISNPDVLIQLNALELVTSLASSNHGLSYLQEQTRVIQNLVDKLLKLNEEPLSVTLLPGLIEFFGNLFVSCPEHFTNEYPQIMELLFNSVDTNDEVLLGVIVTTVGKIGSTKSGRLALNKYEELLKGSFLKKIGKIVATKNNITIPATNCIGELVKDIDGDPKMSAIALEWFQSVPSNTLDNIISLTKLPFIEYRLAGLAFLKAIASQLWGTEKLANYPGMLEFLTDRSSEFNKDCKQMKFEVISIMLQSQNIEKIVPEQMLLNLKSYVREGPFYVHKPAEMATEGAE